MFICKNSKLYKSIPLRVLFSFLLCMHAFCCHLTYNYLTSPKKYPLHFCLLTNNATSVNVNDPPAQQQQAQYQPVKAPAGFTSTHTLHTSPKTALNIKKTSYSISNLNNQFGTAASSGAPAQPIYPPYQAKPQQYQQQHYQHSQQHYQQQQQQQVRQQSFYPPTTNKTATYSMPEMSAPVRQAVPNMPQFASPSQAKPAYSSQPQFQPPSSAPFRPGPSGNLKTCYSF